MDEHGASAGFYRVIADEKDGKIIVILDFKECKSSLTPTWNAI
jgi:hypothetical protein